MHMLLLELIGKDIAVVSDDKTGSESQYRDLGVLKAFDGKLLKLRKSNEERVYYFLPNVNKIIAELYAFDPILEPVDGKGEVTVAPGDLMKELEKQVVSISLFNSSARTDGLLEAYDDTTLRLNTGGQFVYFPLRNIRMIRPTGI